MSHFRNSLSLSNLPHKEEGHSRHFSNLHGPVSYSQHGVLLHYSSKRFGWSLGNVCESDPRATISFPKSYARLMSTCIRQLIFRPSWVWCTSTVIDKQHQCILNRGNKVSDTLCFVAVRKASSSERSKQREAASRRLCLLRDRTDQPDQIIPE